MVLTLFKRFRRDRAGNMVVVAAFAAVPLAGAVGFGLDTLNIVRVRSALQNAVDAAVFVAAVSNMQGESSTTTSQSAGNIFQGNFAASAAAFVASAPSFTYLGSVPDADGNIVTKVKASVAYERIMPVPFSGQAGSYTVNAAADAIVQPGEPACIFALNDHAPRAVEVTGSSIVDMEHCVIGSNSSADDALYVGGNGKANVECAVSSGGIDQNGGLTTSCARSRTNAWHTPDPLAELAAPLPGVLEPNPSNAATTVSPGRYRNLSLKNTKTLEPGFYYVEGDLSIQGDVTANNVTIFMADGAISLTGSASLRVTPPTSGDYAGISFFGSRTNADVQKFTGNGTIDVDGYVYFPAANVIFQGTSAADSSCLRIIADTITMTGNNKFVNGCDTVLGGRETRLSSFPRLAR